MTMQPDLLEELKCAAGCEYISDLKEVSMAQKIKTALQNIEPGRFSIKEWNKAIQYLTGALIAFEEAQTAIEFLMMRLK